MGEAGKSKIRRGGEAPRAGFGPGDGHGLREWEMNAFTQAPLGNLMAPKRPDCLTVELKRHLLIPRSALELSERPHPGSSEGRR